MVGMEDIDTVTFTCKKRNCKLASAQNIGPKIPFNITQNELFNHKKVYLAGSSLKVKIL